MGHDIIEIALERITDAEEFEKIASEVLYIEGYFDIKPMPGGNDFGQDAVEDRLYCSGEFKRTVFQYSLQSYTKGKIGSTINRLKQAGIDFSELVYVTNRLITGENQELLKREVRKQHSINLDIYERQTFITRLADFANGLFYRHFPDIEKQIQALKKNRPIVSEEYTKSLEYALLKVSIAFTFNKHAQKTRKDIFDNLILSLIYDSDNDSMSFEEIVKCYKDRIDESIEAGKIKACINRLKSRKQIDYRNNKCSLTLQAQRTLESSTIAANEYTESLLNDIVREVITISNKSLSLQERNRIKKNSLDILIELFKLFGIELANQFIDQLEAKTFELKLQDHFVKMASKNLPYEIGDLLVAVISEILKNPTEVQANTISNWAKSYIGIKLMNLDPNLKELQHEHFSKKIFLLDTDFLLNCVIKERPFSAHYCQLIRDLLSLGCRVAITKDVIEECIAHAAISHRTNTFFGASLHNLNDELVEVEVQNLFVQGYFHFYRKHQTSYQQYLSNYYNEDDAFNFFIDVIYDVMPNNVEVVNLDDFTVDIPSDIFDKVKNRMLSKLSKSIKAGYRTQEQTEELAINDTKLFLTCYYLNAKSAKQRKILGGTSYLLTLSNRYLKCSKEVGINDIVTVKPQSISSLLELIGKTTVQPRDFVRLMDNPFLAYSVEQCWPDLQSLVKSGIQLNEKSLPKLKWDLQEILHEHLAAYSNENVNELYTDQALTDGKLEKFVGLIKAAKKLGYRNLPEIDLFIREIEDAKAVNENLEDKLDRIVTLNENLKSEIERFGKRKQYYLDRIAKKKK